MNHEPPHVLSFWTSRRILFFCGFVFAALALHILWIYFTDTAHTSLLRRGDFASFYSAAMILRQKLNAQLYDTRLLAYVQNFYWPSLRGAHISFPYPPFTALLLQPFAYVPPQLAKLLFNLLMVLTAALSLKTAGRYFPVLSRNPFASGVFLLAFFPISFGILGSQFTAVNMLLCACLISACARGEKGEIAAGIVLGLWCFKPQYGGALILFFLAARRWKVVVPAVCVCFLYYLLGVLVQGWQWPWIWIQAAGKAAAIDFQYNDLNMISLAGFFHALGRLFGLNARAASIFQWVSWIFSALLFAWAGLLFRQAGNLEEQEMREKYLFRLVLLAMPLLLLASPHALFYDLGICVIACAGFLSLDTDRAIWGLILFTAAASLAAAVKAYLPFQPLIFCLFWALWMNLKNVNSGCGIYGFKGK